MQKHFSLGQRIMGFFLGMIFMVPIFIFAIYILHEERLWFQLNATGQKMSGLLVDTTFSHRGKPTSYYLVYQYMFPDQQGVNKTYQKKEKVPVRQYDQFGAEPQGTVIPLVYLPNNPSSVRVAYERATFQPGLFLSLFLLCPCLWVGSACIASAFSDLIGLFIPISFDESKRITIWLSLVFMLPIWAGIWVLSGMSS